MRNRDVKFQIWLSKEEAELLKQKAQRSRISVAAYIRHLIKGGIPQEAPPPDYFSMMRQLHAIGNNLNQIAQKAHMLNVIDVQQYDAALQQLEDAIRTITKAVIRPRPIEA